MQPIITGNQFQLQMNAKFNKDLSSALANISNVRGKEELVYRYIMDIGSLFQQKLYNMQDGNLMGLYSDYDTFKKHFIKYWKNALGFSREDLDELKDIFDEELSSQESCKNRPITSVFFENDKALTIEDCLNAVYEVMKMA